MTGTRTRTVWDLPFEARLEIYSLAGLIRPCPIDLGPPPQASQPPGRRRSPVNVCFFRDRQRGIIRQGVEGSDCVCAKLPMQLLLVSRAMHDEVIAVLFGRNKFCLRRHPAADWAPLHTMNVAALASMTSLLIRLNCWPCPRGHDQVTPAGLECSMCTTPGAKGDPVLSATKSTGQQLLGQWRALCKHLSSTISPGQLRLTVICDVDDIKTGEQVVESLMTLPTLKECNIRLGRQQHDGLKALARETSLQMTNQYVPKSGFPFERLPRELRLQILDFTHLGARGAYHDRHGLLRIEKNRLVKGDVNRVYRRPTCCSKCTPTFADCCCPTTHGSYSETCDCRLLPFELFLVSRQVYQDALEILYSRSCFDFYQTPVQTIIFLTALPQGALRYIRRIQFRFTKSQFQRWETDKYDQQWQELMVFVEKYFDVSKLLIIINTMSIGDLCLWAETEEENRFVYDIYYKIARALGKIHGLKDVRFDLGWFTDLSPFLAKEVLGERYRNSGPQVVSSRRNRMHELPSWHSI